MVQQGRWTAVLVAVGLVVCAAPARASETLFAFSGSTLYSVSADAPGTPLSTVPITVLGSNEFPVALDVRPKTQTLYLLTYNTAASPDQLHLYVVNPVTGVIAEAGPAFTSPVSTQGTTQYVTDFNPL